MPAASRQTTSLPPAKPFLKWAGGKTQLLPAIEAAFPAPYKSGRPFTYIEPFVGSGAVLFWVLNHFPQVKKAVVNDINSDLAQAYQCIKENPVELIGKLDGTVIFSTKRSSPASVFFGKKGCFQPENNGGASTDGPAHFPQPHLLQRPVPGQQPGQVQRALWEIQKTNHLQPARHPRCQRRPAKGGDTQRRF
jgi:hypothetical protein